MAGPLQQRLLRPASEPSSLLLVVTVAASLVRVADQPSLEVSVGGTDVSLVPTDLLFAALAAATALRLVQRGGLARQVRWIVGAAAAFAMWLALSAVPNGAAATVAAGRLLELALLGLGVIVLVERRDQLWLLVATLVAVTTVAVAVGVVGFLTDPGARQGSFLGEHDLAALSSLSLSIALAALHSRGAAGWLPLVAGIAGALGIVLGAALASLLGLYLAAAAVLAVALARSSLRARAVLLTAVILATVTAGTLAQRSGELGFLRFLAQEEEERPGEFAASWSQRLIYAYVGLRVFEENPIVGTGWYPNLPPSEFARFLPDARARFPGQPARYFPRGDGAFVPQQTPDQVLYELGLVGAALFLLLAAATVRSAVAIARAWPRDDDELLGYLPAAWTGAIGGAVAGGALFGGTPLAALFWLTLGAVAVTAVLAPRPEPAGAAVARPSVARAAR